MIRYKSEEECAECGQILYMGAVLGKCTHCGSVVVACNCCDYAPDDCTTCQNGSNHSVGAFVVSEAGKEAHLERLREAVKTAPQAASDIRGIMSVYRELYESFDPDGDIAAHIEYEVAAGKVADFLDSFGA